MKISRIQIYIFLVFISSFLSHDASGQDSIVTVTGRKQSPAIWKQIENSEYRNYHDPVVLHSGSPVYAQPDSLSEILITLPFGTPLVLLAEAEIDGELNMDVLRSDSSRYAIKKYTRFTWYEIVAGRSRGYIKYTDIATHNFISGKNKGYLVHPGSDYKTAEIIHYNEDKFQEILRVPYVNSYSAFEIGGNSFINLNKVLRFTAINREEGTRKDLFLAHQGDSIYIITEGGDLKPDSIKDARIFAHVYFPVKFNNGKVMLLENGDPERAFDIAEGNVRSLQLPATVKFLPQDMMVRVIKTEKTVSSSQPGDKPDVLKSSETEYYKWAGRKFVLLRK